MKVQERVNAPIKHTGKSASDLIIKIRNMTLKRDKCGITIIEMN